MTINRLSQHSGLARPARALLLMRASTGLRSGSEVLDRFASLEDLARRSVSGPFRLRRRLIRGASFGPEYLPWEERLPELQDVDLVVVEDRTRISRSVRDIEAFEECLERFEARLLCLFDFNVLPDPTVNPDEEEP